LKINFSLQERTILFGGISQLFAKFSSLFFFYIISPMLIDFHGFEVLSDWAKINSIFLVLSFLDFGNNNKLLNDIVLENNDYRNLVSTMFYRQILIGIIAFIVLFFFFRKSVFISAIFLASFQSVSALTMKTLEGENKLFIAQISLFVSYMIMIPFVIYFMDNIKVVYALIVFPHLLSMLINLVFIRKYFVLAQFFERFKAIFNQKFSTNTFFFIAVLSVVLNISDTYLLRSEENSVTLAQIELLKKIILLTAPLQYFILPMWPKVIQEVDLLNSINVKKRLAIALLGTNLFAVIFFTTLLPTLLPLFNTTTSMISYHLIAATGLMAFMTPIFGFATLYLNHPGRLKNQLILMLIAVVLIVGIKALIVQMNLTNYIVYVHVLGLSLFYLYPALKKMKINYV